MPHTGAPARAVEGKRNLSKEWSGYALKIVLAADLIVEGLYQVDDCQRYKDTQHQSNKINHVLLWSHWSKAAAWSIDNSGVVCGKGLVKFVLLSLLEKEEVDGLLNGLLSLNAEEVLGLVRVGGNPSGSLCACPVQGTHLGVEVGDLVIHGRNDCSTHSVELLVHFLYQRVLCAGRVCQVVTVEKFLVVFLNLVLKAGALSTEAGREKLGLIFLVSQVVADVLGHIELVAEFLLLVADLGALLHVHCSGSCHIRNHLLALVGGNVAIYVGKLVLNNLQTVINEQGSTPRNLVLVSNPVLVVNADEGIEDILGPWNGTVFYCEGDNSGHLVRDSGRKLGTVTSDSSIKCRFPYIYLLYFRVRSLGSDENDVSDWRINAYSISFVQNSVSTSGNLFPIICEVFKFDFALRLEINLKVSALHIRKVRKLYVERKGVGIKHLLPESQRLGIINIQMETAYNLPHCASCTKCFDLIVHAGFALEEAEVCHTLDAGREGTPLVVFLYLNLSCTGILWLEAYNVYYCNEKAYGYAEHKPFPSSQTCIDKVFDV